MEEQPSRASSAVSIGTFIPLALLVLTLLIQSASQTVQLLQQQQALSVQYAAQRQPLARARALRHQLQAIAGATAELAEQGNENAMRVRAYLRQQGITIRPLENETP